MKVKYSLFDAAYALRLWNDGMRVNAQAYARMNGLLILQSGNIVEFFNLVDLSPATLNP